MKREVRRLWAWVMPVLALSVPIVALAADKNTPAVPMVAVADGQTPPPVPIVPVAAGQNAPPAVSDNPVFRVTTTLVQVDAVVTDSKGRQIVDLSAGDFEILADGHSQPITHFSYVRVAPDAVSAAVPSKAPRGPRSHLNDVAPPAPAIALRPEDVHRTIVLFVDDLGLSWESIAYVRRALGKFVDQQMQPGDLVAVVRSGGGSGALQQFTADKQVLHAEVDRIRWNPNGRRGLDAIPAVSRNPNTARTAPQASASSQSEAGSLFAGTLASLKSVVRWLRGMPGRKSVIVFSDGFSPLPSASSRSRLEAENSVIQGMRSLIDGANRAGAVIYTVDPRGLQPLYPDAKDDMGAHQPVPRGSVQEFISKLNAAMNETMASRVASVHSDQFGLEFLAEATGGLFYRDNDVNDGIGRFLEDQKGYYLIGYKPGDGDFDDVNGQRPFHRIRVKVRRPGLHVRSGSGFIGTTDEEEKQRLAPPANQLQAVLLSPFGASGIRMRLTPQYQLDPQAGPRVHNLLYIDAHDLAFKEQPDGSFQATIDLLAGATGGDGQTLSIGRVWKLQVEKANMAQVLRDGVILSIDAHLKKAGPYQARAAIRDESSGKVGSASQYIDIPVVNGRSVALNSVTVDNGALPDGHAFQGVDPAKREFRGGGQILYACLADTADSAHYPRDGMGLETEVRLFHDGRLVYSGQPTVAAVEGRNQVALTGRLPLPDGIPTGQYYLQIVARDSLAGTRSAAVSQSVDFRDCTVVIPLWFEVAYVGCECFATGCCAGTSRYSIPSERLTSAMLRRSTGQYLPTAPRREAIQDCRLRLFKIRKGQDSFWCRSPFVILAFGGGLLGPPPVRMSRNSPLRR